MAKKKRRRGTAAPAVDPTERRRERLEARRQAKAEALAARRRAETREKIIRRVVIVALLAGVFWFLFLRTQAPDTIAGHEVVEVASTGVGQHQPPPISYETSPPVAGPHAQAPAACGVHGAPIPNENLVHTLEHGGVGVLYKPDLALEDIRTIESIVSGFDSHAFSAPYPEMETPITVVSWAHYMRLDSLEEDAIREYIDEFREGGPEKQDCPNTQDAPFEPTPVPTESPAATATPEPTES